MSTITGGGTGNDSCCGGCWFILGGALGGSTVVFGTTVLVTVLTKVRVEAILLAVEEGLQGKICPVRLGVVCPLVLREGYQGKACLHICSLSPGAPRRTPGEDLSVFV